MRITHAAAAREVLDGEDAPVPGRNRNRGSGRRHRDVPVAKQGKAGGRAHTPRRQSGYGRRGYGPRYGSPIWLPCPYPRRRSASAATDATRDAHRSAAAPSPSPPPTNPNDATDDDGHVGDGAPPLRNSDDDDARSGSRPRERRSSARGRKGARAGRMTAAAAAAAAAGVCAFEGVRPPDSFVSAGARRR